MVLLKYLKVKYRSENNFVGPSNNYVERLNIDDKAAKRFNTLANLNVLYNYSM